MQYNACKSISVRTWTLNQSTAQGKNLGSGVDNYHSHTPGIIANKVLFS
jgi:hypothetical protein